MHICNPNPNPTFVGGTWYISNLNTFLLYTAQWKGWILQNLSQKNTRLLEYKKKVAKNHT